MRVIESERTWNWLDDGALPYLLAAMRAVWIWLLLHVWANIVLARADVISPFTVFVLLAVSTLFAQLAAFRLRDARGAWLVALGGIIAVALAVYAAFGYVWFQDFGALVITIFAAAWCWRWGILAGREPLTYDTFSRNFMYGVVALALVGFIVFTTRLFAPGELILPILFFFAFGLSALALASLRDAQQYERAKLGAAFALNRYWLITVGIVIAGMLVIGLLLGGTFAPEWAQRVIAALLSIWQFVTAILLLLVLAIAAVFFGAFDLLGRVIHFTPENPKPSQIEIPNLGALLQNQNTPPPQVPPELYLLVQIVAALFIAALLAALFALALRRFRNYTEEDVTETRDSVFSIELLQAQLRKLFQRDAAKPNAVAPYAEIRGKDARAQIRKLYQEFLMWAETRGVPRRAGQTPREFQNVLELKLRLQRAPLTIITNAYVNARYNESAITTTDVQQVQDAWQSISQSEQVQDAKKV